MATGAIEYGPSRQDDGYREERYLRSKLGAGNWVYDFLPLQYFETVMVSGSADTGALSNDIGPYIRLTSGVNANSYYESFVGGASAGDHRKSFPAGTGGSWGFSAMAKFTGVDAAVRTTIDIRNDAGTAFVRFGLVGTVDAANLCVDGDTADITTTTAPDANFHIFRCYRSGTTTTFEQDGVSLGTGNVFPAAACGMHIIASNGATASARTLDIQWIAMMYPRAS